MMSLGRLAGFFAASCLAPVESAHLLRHGGNVQNADGLVKPLEFNHQLRVCNAFPNSQTLDVFKASEKLTKDAPMQYKTCADFSSPLRAGDKLDFHIADVTDGTFSVAELPKSDAVLLLVVHLHDQHSTAMSFESHVFGENHNAQVAVIDTYRGTAKANPWIRDEAAGNLSRSEQLRYNSVVAVNAGKYDVALDDEEGVERARSDLVALDRGAYVVLRTGSETQFGERFPEELLVFPQSDPSLLHSGSEKLHITLPVFLVTFIFCRFA
jgi:hypothetical protein